MFKSIVHIAIVITGCLPVVHAQTIDVSSIKNFEVINRHISMYDSVNKQVIHLDIGEDVGIAWIRNSGFSTGTIEFDVRGKDILQQSFVGIAFHGVNDSSYEAVYFRPFNFQSTDSIRKKHSVQYICLPEYDWAYLRETFPGKYESSLTQVIEPSKWFHAKIVVAAKSITVYVDNDNHPSLIVEPLTNNSAGRIGLWTGKSSDGDFSNLTVKPN